MGRRDSDDAVGKVELDDTETSPEAGPDSESSVTESPKSETASKTATALRPEAPAEEPAADEPEVPSHRRGPGLWLPLIVFVVLLVAGAVAGSVIVPGSGPEPGAAPPASIAVPGLTQPAPVDSDRPDLVLPTAPERPADQLEPWAARIGGAVSVPTVAMAAYGYAQLSMAREDPACHLGWTTLAAVGEVESAHGQTNGAVLQSNGRSAPLIMGPVLDGKSGRALVKDTDAGAFDADTTFDRAMGPLGLTPTTWRAYGIDADGDGILDPYDIDDSSLALGRLLCAGTEDLGKQSDWNAAIARQRAGGDYAKSVFTSANSYGQRTKSMG